MYRIALKPSRYVATASILVHAAGMLSVWFTQLPMTAVLVINLLVAGGCARNHWFIARGRILALELSTDSCRLVLGLPKIEYAELLWPVYSLPFLQIMYFRRNTDEQIYSSGTRCFKLIKARIRFPVILCVDSCSRQDMRRLRTFIRWKTAN